MTPPELAGDIALHALADIQAGRDPHRKDQTVTTDIWPEARAAMLRAEADQLESTHCTGLTATWCPIHGDCLCGERDVIGRRHRGDGFHDMDDPRCPLHAPTSSHAEGPTP